VTLTLDRVILHTVVHHSSTSSYTPNFTEIKATFCGWMDVLTDVWMASRTNIRDRLYYADSVKVLT